MNRNQSPSEIRITWLSQEKALLPLKSNIFDGHGVELSLCLCGFPQATISQYDLQMFLKKRNKNVLTRKLLKECWCTKKEIRYDLEVYLSNSQH